MAEQENKTARGRANFGATSEKSILGTPEIEQDHGDTGEEPQATAAREGSKPTEGHGIAGCPILGTGRAIFGNSILGTPKI